MLCNVDQIPCWPRKHQQLINVVGELVSSTVGEMSTTRRREKHQQLINVVGELVSSIVDEMSKAKSIFIGAW